MLIILSAGFFMSLFLIVLMAGKKSKTNTDGYLLSMLVVYALTIGGAYFEIFNHHNGYPYPHVMNISWLFLFLHGPFLWLYVKSLTTNKLKFEGLHLLHFIPFTLFLVLQYFAFIRLPAEEKVLVAQNELFRNTLLFKISVPAIGISTLTYNIWALLMIRKHKKKIMNQYSNIEQIDLKWLSTLVIAALMVFTVNVILYNLNNLLHLAGYYELSQIAYVFATFYVLYLGFFGIRQGKIFADNPTADVILNPQPVNQGARKADENGAFSDIIRNLTRLMEQEQPYLDPELSLSKLSGLLQVRPEQLSEVLNSSLNQNFFDFVNKYRIEEFKIRCLSKANKHLSIIGIAYDCGFNSKATFYRTFNKFEGISPTTYISKVS